MSAPDFLDSNVLIYAYDPFDPRKRAIAEGLVRQAVRGQAVLSLQVLTEAAVAFLYKQTPPATPDEVGSIFSLLEGAVLPGPKLETSRRALDAKKRYGIHIYDGLIVAAAEQAGCKRIFSEDLNAGQEYFGVIVENPFAAPTNGNR